jgi:hypothetical protein
MCPSFVDSLTQVAGVGLLLFVTPEMFAKVAALGKVPAANVTLVGSVTGVGPFVDLHFAAVAEELLADVALKSPEIYIIFFFIDTVLSTVRIRSSFVLPIFASIFRRQNRVIKIKTKKN